MHTQTISHYRLLNHLGTSLLGEVYLAEDLSLGRKVALTLLPDRFTRDAEKMRKLAQEARVLSSLNHPNIRMIYEVGSDGSDHFIASEFVEGPTLRVHLGYTRMTVNEVIDVSLQIVAGLQAAHAEGVLHKDIKPENIMLRPDGYVKILDFGIAKLAEQDSMMVDLQEPAAILEPTPVPGSTTEEIIDPVDAAPNQPAAAADQKELKRDPYRTSPLDADSAMLIDDRQRAESGLWWAPGTAGYLSPEQALNEEVDHRSDLFSLGVVIYEMCTGRIPFAGHTVTGVLNSILDDTYQPIKRYMPEAPDEFDWIVSKALAKNREDRYQTAREIQNDLKRLKQRIEYEDERGRRPEIEIDEETSGGRRQTTFADSGRSDQSDQRSGRDSSSGQSRAATGLNSGSGASRAGSDVVDSIAILPLANAGTDPAVEYLSDGITESIINALSRINGLRVMARSTVFRYKGRDVDPQEVAREMNVRAVMIGRLLQRGETIIIKAELVDADDGSLIWAEQYQRKSGDIFELEADIARQISEHLRVKLTGDQRENLAKRHTDNPQAYDLYLKGRFFWNQRSPESMKRGIEYFVQAIKKDENYALAYSGLADCYTLLSWYAVPPREFVPKARISVIRALEIDEQLTEAHASLGFLTLWYDWDFFKAEMEFRRAISLNPNYPTAHHWYSYCLMVMERFDEARASIKRALDLDPLSLIVITDIGEQQYRRRQYDNALTQFQKALEMDKDFELARYWMLRTWIDQGKLDDALGVLESLPAREGRYGNTALLAIAYARAGKRDDARNVLGKILEHAKDSYVPPYYLAMIEASLGDKEQAFSWLDRAYQERSGWIPWLKLDPMADSLRTDARFTDLLRRIGLKP